jgi:hypothetical protein
MYKSSTPTAFKSFTITIANGNYKTLGDTKCTQLNLMLLTLKEE